MPASWKTPSPRTPRSGSGATKDGKRNGKKNSVNCGSIDSKPMAYYLLYAFLYLVSLLPMRLLYLLSDGFYLLVYHVLKYRRDVVMSNLLIAFPEKTEIERIRIAKKFYHNFIDSFVEVIKLVSANDAFLKKRFTADTGELADLYKTGKSCHL